MKPLELFETNVSKKRYLACLLACSEYQIGEEFEFQPGIRCIEESTGNMSTEQLLLVKGENWTIGIEVLGYLRPTGELELTVIIPVSGSSDKTTRYFTIYTTD